MDYPCDISCDIFRGKSDIFLLAADGFLTVSNRLQPLKTKGKALNPLRFKAFLFWRRRRDLNPPTNCLSALMYQWFRIFRVTNRVTFWDVCRSLAI